jgi:hypothetical protein
MQRIKPRLEEVHGRLWNCQRLWRGVRALAQILMKGSDAHRRYRSFDRCVEAPASQHQCHWSRLPYRSRAFRNLKHDWHPRPAVGV